MAIRHNTDAKDEPARELPARPLPPVENPPKATQDAQQAYAKRVGEKLVKELPEGSSAEAGEGYERPTLRAYTPSPKRGNQTTIIGLTGDGEDVDMAYALETARGYWGL